MKSGYLPGNLHICGKAAAGMAVLPARFVSFSGKIPAGKMFPMLCCNY